jgi:hypothetical protein
MIVICWFEVVDRSTTPARQRMSALPPSHLPRDLQSDREECVDSRLVNDNWTHEKIEHICIAYTNFLSWMINFGLAGGVADFAVSEWARDDSCALEIWNSGS